MHTQLRPDGCWLDRVHYAFSIITIVTVQGPTGVVDNRTRVAFRSKVSTENESREHMCVQISTANV